jgi:hypothetical protein
MDCEFAARSYVNFSRPVVRHALGAMNDCIVGAKFCSRQRSEYGFFGGEEGQASGKWVGSKAGGNCQTCHAYLVKAMQ